MQSEKDKIMELLTITEVTSGGRYVKDGCYRGLRRRFAVRISK